MPEYEYSRQGIFGDPPCGTAGGPTHSAAGRTRSPAPPADPPRPRPLHAVLPDRRCGRPVTAPLHDSFRVRRAGRRIGTGRGVHTVESDARRRPRLAHGGRASYRSAPSAAQEQDEDDGHDGADEQGAEAADAIAEEEEHARRLPVVRAFVLVGARMTENSSRADRATRGTGPKPGMERPASAGQGRRP